MQLTFCAASQDTPNQDTVSPITSDDVDKMVTKVTSPPIGNDVLFIANITFGAMKYMGVQVRDDGCV